MNKKYFRLIFYGIKKMLNFLLQFYEKNYVNNEVLIEN